MSTNGANVEDAEMAECDGEKVVTMMDVLQEQQAFEEDANAVLGASDDKNCTYSKGYIKRQAIYACLTCCGDAREDPTKRAGVCLACSLACHENHDLVELYTKRNFRCDCGNPKFQHPCTYTQNKTQLNDENHYDQNFSGLYCICHRPYPDPDGVEEEMIQCIICEDWLHASHLEATIPSSDSYAEMICKACMEKNEFLHGYSEFAVNGDVDIMGIDEMESSVGGNEGSKINGIGGVTETNSKVEDKSKEDIKEETKLDTDSTEVTDASPTINETADICNGDKSIEIENKVTENESEPAATEVPTEKPVSDEQIPANTEAENAQTDVDMISENNKNTENSTTEANNADGSSKDEAKVENDKDIQQDDGSSNVPMQTACSNDETFNKEESTTNLEVIEKEQHGETNEMKTTTEAVEPKLDLVETEMNETETNTGDIKPAEEEKIASTELSEIKSNEQVTNNDKPLDSNESNDNNSTTKQDNDMDESANVINNEITSKEHKRKLSIEDDEDISVKKPKLGEKQCIRPNNRRMFKGATFWPSNFRQKLCTCNECITMYRDLSVLFLIDPEDTVMSYETLGKEQIGGTSSTSSYERGLEALSSLDRIQQINAVTEYNRMRDKLLEFLKSFKDRREVVKEEDIKTFFANMKPKREPDGVYFCR